MNEPNDPRPLQTVNRLRLVVFIPAFIAVVGILMLGSKLALKFREIEEPPARDYPPSPPPTAGRPGRPLNPVLTRPKARQTTAAATNPIELNQAVTSAAGSAPGIGAEPQGSNALAAVGAVPSAVSLVVGGVTRSTKALPTNGIVGRVFLRGTPPPEKEIPMDPTCGKLHAFALKTRFFVVDAEGGLEDVFLLMLNRSSISWQNAPLPPNIIHQRGCEYVPYISGVVVGQTIRVFNDDPLMHNVHPTPVNSGNSEQNHAQLPAGPPLEFTFATPELFLRFKCDVHPWMFAYVNVSPNPFFAVSGTNGAFSIPVAPPGDYTLQITHRKAGGKSVPVKVQAGKRLVVTVTLDLADPARSEATVTEE